MMKHLFKALAIVSILGCFTMMSCQKSSDNLILGKWNLTLITEGSQTATPEELGMTATFEFKEDLSYNAHYTMVFYQDTLTQDENGTYVMLDNNKIQLSWVEDGVPMTTTDDIVSLTNEELVLTERYEDEELGTIESVRTYKRI